MTVILLLKIIAYSVNDTLAMIFWSYKHSNRKIDRALGNLDLCGKSHLKHSGRHSSISLRIVMLYVRHALNPEADSGT